MDETLIRDNGEHFWQYASVDSETNYIRQIRLYSRQTTAITVLFLAEFKRKHELDHGEFLVDAAS